MNAGAGIRVSLLVAAAMAGFGGPARAQEPAPANLNPNIRPTSRETSCLKSGCHAKEKNFKFVHGPVSVGACQMCHVYADDTKHTFELKREKTKLCEFCHVGKTEGIDVHKPVQQGQCLQCHSPHGGSNRELLRQDNTNTLCISCHDKVTRNRKYAHGPVATGSCSACHKSHTSMYPHLLVAQGRQLCLDCHKDMDRQLASVTKVHKPVTGDCQQCHEPHASNFRGHLKQAPKDLCVSCHEHDRIKKLIDNAPLKHSPVVEGQACVNCHAPHGGNLANLMKGARGAACLACHDKAIKSPDGRVIVGGLPELLDPDVKKHGPIRDGNCGGCHEVHGGRIAHLLAEPYPATFYEPFDVDKYALCFSCHASQLATQRESDRITGFRNGTTNLHYLHVTPAKQGRTCRACHNTHASKNPMHMAENVRFGNWELPINYEKTQTGGACTSGCHKRLAYDRVTPVEQKGPVEIKPTDQWLTPKKDAAKGKTP